MDPKLNSLFRMEAADHLQKMDEALLALERGEPAAPLLNTLFRSSHFLKGSAPVFGLAKVAEVAHRLEDLLDLLRGRAEQAIAPNLIDTLFQGRDLFGQLMGGDDQTPPEYPRFLSQIEARLHELAP